MPVLGLETYGGDLANTPQAYISISGRAGLQFRPADMNGGPTVWRIRSCSSTELPPVQGKLLGLRLRDACKKQGKAFASCFFPRVARETASCETASQGILTANCELAGQCKQADEDVVASAYTARQEVGFSA